MASLASDRADYPAALRYATARTATEPQTAATAAPRRAAPPQQCAERSAGIGFSKSDSAVSAAAGAGVGLSQWTSECGRYYADGIAKGFRSARMLANYCGLLSQVPHARARARTHTHTNTHTHKHTHTTHTLTHHHQHHHHHHHHTARSGSSSPVR
jgi:hypothetical protein